MNYYNEFDPFAAAWLKELISAGILPKGDVDARDIREIKPSELTGYTQLHFFAGIGGWPYALRLAGWPDDRPVWTGSCPCQPFSVAGKGGGLEDERHLWPAFRWLIAQCRPPTIFGEQVASKAGREWLAGVRSDLEALGYAVGAADLCAAGISAPHIRQRLWWVGFTQGFRLQKSRQEQGYPPEPSGRACGLADTEHPERRQGDATRNKHDGNDSGRQEAPSGFAECRPVDWRDSIFIPCADGKWRRVPGRVVQSDSTGPQSGSEATEAPRHRGSVDATGGEPGEVGFRQTQKMEPYIEVELSLFPLANGLPNRVGILRGAGNAVVPQVAAQFIKAFTEAQNGNR